MIMLLITRSDGGVSAMVLTEGSDIEQEVAKWESSAPWRSVSHRVIDLSELPADTTFRNAWVDRNGCIEHDMDKAREIHKSRLRALRAPLFEKNDIAIQNALIAKDDAAVAALDVKARALRDATSFPAIAAATTVDQLKAAVPDALK